MSHVDESEERVIEISWPELLLALALVGLIVQLWPYCSAAVDVALTPVRFVFNLCDIRQWTWRSYAVANGAAFVALAIARLRRGRE